MSELHFMTRRFRLKRLSLFVLATVGLFVLGTGILVAVGLHDQPGRADIGLVLGSKVELNGKPSPRLRARLDRTLELYRAGYFPAVIASGGFGKEGYDEATVMKGYLVSHGIPGEKIIVDSAGTTTFASAQNTLKIVRQRKLNSVFVVSQYFHIPRARMALRRFGISTVYSAHAHFYEARDIYASPRELVAYVSYIFRRYDPATASSGIGTQAATQ